MGTSVFFLARSGDTMGAMRPARTLGAGVLAVLLVQVWMIAADRPATLKKADADAAVKAILKDRADTEGWLRADPTSYLAAVARTNFDGRTVITVGRAPDNDVRLDAPDIASHHLRVTVKGPKFLVEGVDASARFTADKKEQRAATVDPSKIGVGRFVLRLSHQNFPAIIVFDPKSPRFKEYKGIKYFPVDLAYRYEAAFTPNPKAERVTIMSTQGSPRKAMRAGWFDLEVGGTPVRIEATRLLEPGVGENDLSIFFRDATSGKESYGFGRYVDPMKLPNGKFLIDFNMAYNPACAFSDFYNCPVPPKENTLAVAIRAGEMDSHYH
jgi:uncharacterized protein (DUF1684 family)